MFSVSAFRLDCALGSQESEKFIGILLDADNSQILKTEIIKMYTDTMWKKAVKWILVQELLLLFFAILLTIEVEFQSTSMKVGLLIYLCVLMTNEVYQFVLDEWQYFNDFWNILDFIRIIFSLGYLVSGVYGVDFHSNMGRP